ncbi:hypothetical protein [Bifidobacterium adolescentis]|uniref:hypothetical protein n=1 Tax=Bifidobacterium adolescentis TaxID=1680 RepID=UPI001F3CA7BB|nr:hypothetical protein [Bifidobacterium adolescentis]
MALIRERVESYLVLANGEPDLPMWFINLFDCDGGLDLIFDYSDAIMHLHDFVVASQYLRQMVDIADENDIPVPDAWRVIPDVIDDTREFNVSEVLPVLTAIFSDSVLNALNAGDCEWYPVRMELVASDGEPLTVMGHKLVDGNGTLLAKSRRLAYEEHNARMRGCNMHA